jgi:hypothetical protein
MVPFFVFLFCLFATYGTYLLVTRKSAEDRARLEKRWREVLLGQEDDDGPGMGKVDTSNIRLARQEILSEIPRFDALLKKLEFVNWIKKMIDQSDLQLTVMRLFMFCGLSGLLGMMAGCHRGGLADGLLAFRAHDVEAQKTARQVFV